MRQLCNIFNERNVQVICKYSQPSHCLSPGATQDGQNRWKVVNSAEAQEGWGGRRNCSVFSIVDADDGYTGWAFVTANARPGSHLPSESSIFSKLSAFSLSVIFSWEAVGTQQQMTAPAAGHVRGSLHSAFPDLPVIFRLYQLSQLFAAPVWCLLMMRNRTIVMHDLHIPLCYELACSCLAWCYF